MLFFPTRNLFLWWNRFLPTTYKITLLRWNCVFCATDRFGKRVCQFGGTSLSSGSASPQPSRTYLRSQAITSRSARPRLSAAQVYSRFMRPFSQHLHSVSAGPYSFFAWNCVAWDDWTVTNLPCLHLLGPGIHPLETPLVCSLGLILRLELRRSHSEVLIFLPEVRFLDI